jgi:hypothetical protein
VFKILIKKQMSIQESLLHVQVAIFSVLSRILCSGAWGQESFGVLQQDIVSVS